MLSIITGCVFFSLQAQAEDLKLNNRFHHLELAEKDTITAVSGYAGTRLTAETGQKFQGLTTIEWVEESDDVRKIKIYTYHLNNKKVDLSNGGVVTHSKQDTIKLTSDVKGNSKTVHTVNTSSFVHKIQVCTTDKKKDSSKNKLKGIRIWSRTVNDTNPVTFTDQPSEMEVKHTNCKVWHHAVACGKGQIATGLQGHYTLKTRSFNGIALICNDVKNEKKETQFQGVEKTKTIDKKR
jgi:hypothetical protein